MRFTPEQTDMDKFFAMLATSKQPGLRQLANDYKRSQQKSSLRFQAMHKRRSCCDTKE